MDQEKGILQEKEIFLNKITRVFQECHKVLKSYAPLVFTYHHSNVAAWVMIIEALQNSHFLITAAFPVRSEFGARPVKGRNFDIIIVCRKHAEKISTEKSMSWESLESRIKLKVEKIMTSQVIDRNEEAWEETFAFFLPQISETYSQYPSEDLEKILSRIFNHLKNIKMSSD
jgi:adenine-specific DNA methylase